MAFLLIVYISGNGPNKHDQKRRITSSIRKINRNCRTEERSDGTMQQLSATSQLSLRK